MVALNESTAILDLFYAINGLQKKKQWPILGRSL